MHIRLATSADIPQILELSNCAAANTVANFATEPETLDHWQHTFDTTSPMYPWLIAEGAEAGNQKTLGFAKASPYRARAAYRFSAELTVYIDPSHHRLGIGKALYATLFAMLKAQGYRTLLAGITIPHPASVRLHESFGMKQVAALVKVGWKFDAWHDVGFWQLMFERADPPTEIRPVQSVIHLLPSQIHPNPPRS